MVSSIKSVSTNVAKTFLQLVTNHFSRRQKLHKIFNRNTVKVSYSCMNNRLKKSKGHKYQVTSTARDQTSKCNCRKRSEYPMEGNGQVNDIVYKCDLTRALPKKVYLGHAKGEWKSLLYSYKLSFNRKRYFNKTTRSSYMWHLKKVSNETPNLKLSILRCIQLCSNISKIFHGYMTY